MRHLSLLPWDDTNRATKNFIRHQEQKVLDSFVKKQSTAVSVVNDVFHHPIDVDDLKLLSQGKSTPWVDAFDDVDGEKATVAIKWKDDDFIKLWSAIFEESLRDLSMHKFSVPSESLEWLASQQFLEIAEMLGFEGEKFWYQIPRMVRQEAKDHGYNIHPDNLKIIEAMERFCQSKAN
jgi:hypothetical protein